MSDNVTPIDSARKNKDGKQSQHEKVNPVVLFEHVAQLIRFEGEGVWPTRFRVYEPEMGKRLPIIVKDGEAAVVGLDAVTASIMQFARHKALGSSGGASGGAARGAADTAPPAAWLFDDDKCIKAARYWLRSAKTEAHIPMIAWEGDTAPIAWRRLPWSKNEHGDTPTWDRLTANMTNGEAFRLWMASCFIEAADLSTYLWLHGGGANGKSRIMAFLARAFGPSYFGTDEESARSKHWTAALIGKRVVAFPDTNTRTLTTSGKFKSITGGDSVTVEPKYQPSFAARLPARFIISSNNVPELSSGDADLRRCIFVEMGAPVPIPERIPSAVLDEALWLEGGAFISKCLALYADKCRGHRPIEFDAEATAGLAAESEIDFAHIVDKYLDVGSPTYSMPGSEMLALVRNTCGARVNLRKVGDFVAYLERHYGVKRWKSAGRMKYAGVKLKFEGQAQAAGVPHWGGGVDVY